MADRAIHLTHGGTVLMETVLVLPILVLLVFAVAQFALLLQAQVMTHLAAYNAARAAIVHNPVEYLSGGAFRERSGVCWEAACQTLAPVSGSSGVAETGVGVYGWGGYPNSKLIGSQVKIDPAGSSDGIESGGALPAVKVKVCFQCPLNVPVVGAMLKDSSLGSIPCASLHAYCVLPKPWSTKRFSRRPEDSNAPSSSEGGDIITKNILPYKSGLQTL